MNGNWTDYGYVGYIDNGKKVFVVNDTEYKELFEDNDDDNEEDTNSEETN